MSLLKWLVQEIKRLAVLKTRRSRVAAWVAFNLLLFITVAAALMYRAELERQEAEVDLERTAVNLAASYAEQVGISVATLDEQTLALKHYVEEGKASVDLHAQWNEGIFGLNRLNGIAITDKAGSVLTATLPNASAASLASLPMFGDYQRGVLRGLHIFPPSPGVISGRTIIRFIRDLRTPDGGFNGIVSVGCPPSYFLSVSGKSHLGRRGDLLVRDVVGTVYVRQTLGGIGSGQTMFVHPAILPTTHGFRAMAGSNFKDGVSRYVAWAPISGTKLLTLAALPIDDALVTYRHASQQYMRLAMVWGLFLATACIAGFVLYARLLLRAHETERVKRTYRLATEAAGEGFYMLDPVRDVNGDVADFSIRDCNAFGAKFMDLDSIELIGKTLSDLYPGPYGAKLILLFRKALEKGFEDAEIRLPLQSHYNVEWIHRKMVATEGSLAVTVVDITAKKNQERALRDSANHDSLTGLPNRHWLNGYLPQAVDNARLQGTNLAFFFVDLDNFKDVNDTLGHAAGDLVLQTTAERLKTAVRPQDSVIRLGGDEFTVLIEGIDGVADVRHLAERIITELGRPLMVDGKSVSVLSGSVGISVFPDDAEDGEELLRHADTAMYVAKTQGKTCFAFYTPEIGQVRAARLQLERELRKAVENREFQIYYQPRIQIKSGEIVGAEALVRWSHPEKGLVQPLEFIGLAEQTGLILELGDIVIDIVCAQIEQWTLDGAVTVPISINVSPIQFNRRDIATTVIENASSRQIPAGLIEIELTEAAMVESSTVLEQFARLREFGIKLLVDDFGTGYSSLAQMQHFRLDVLKIDQSLTSKLGMGAEAKVFYQAIVAMGHALSMSITAEGVESREQLNILGDLECDEIQGFLIAKPLTPESFQDFLKSYTGEKYCKRLLSV